MSLAGYMPPVSWDAMSGRAYDMLVAPPTHALVHHLLGAGAILYGGNFAVRTSALAAIGGFHRSIEFHGEDTNLGRRLTSVGSDFHKAKHLYSWKTLLRCEKNWEAIAAALRANVDVALTLYRNGSWAA